ncbi:hypothetical protein MTO96_041243 [Rhipicephalus appendiculatus]
MVANISSADLELRHPPYPPELYPQCLFLPCHGPLKDRCRPGCFCTRVGKNKLCMSIKVIVENIAAARPPSGIPPCEGMHCSGPGDYVCFPYCECFQFGNVHRCVMLAANQRLHRRLWRQRPHG